MACFGPAHGLRGSLASLFWVSAGLADIRFLPVAGAWRLERVRPSWSSTRETAFSPPSHFALASPHFISTSLLLVSLCVDLYRRWTVHLFPPTSRSLPASAVWINSQASQTTRPSTTQGGDEAPSGPPRCWKALSPPQTVGCSLVRISHCFNKCD